MKFLLKGVLFIFLLVSIPLQAQLKLASWNIRYMGKSKSDETITFIAKTLQDFDIIAIQEVVAGYGGSQAVARLANELNRMGADWDYSISLPTRSSNSYRSERYAFLWKKHSVKIKGRSWLDSYFSNNIEREPFMQTFVWKENKFTLVNIHAVPKDKQPEQELKYLKLFPEKYPDKRLIFVGDFNVVGHHTVFNPLKKKGYQIAIKKQRTTLKKSCKKGCLSKGYDHFLLPKTVQILTEGVVPFHLFFRDITLANKVSDHLPIWVEIEFR